MNPDDFAQKLREAYLDAKLEKARKPRPHHTNHPHSAGHPCARYLVLLRVAWGLQSPPSDPIKAALFAEGHHQEHALVSDLRSLHGYTVAMQKVPIAVPDLELVGEWDFCLKQGDGPYYIADAKAVSPGIFRALNSVGHVFTHRRYFVRQWPVQLLLYLEAARRDRAMWAAVDPDVALLILKDKVTGEIRPIPIPWDENSEPIMEHVKLRLQMINEIVANIRTSRILSIAGDNHANYEGTPAARDELRAKLPAPLADQSVCPSCPYYHFCQTEMQLRPLGAAAVLDDPDLEGYLELIAESREGHARYEEALRDATGILDRYAMTFAEDRRAYLVCGSFLVTTTEVRPKDKKPYRKYDVWKRPTPAENR